MEIQTKIDELGRAFEEFKKANDKRLDEIKSKGYASVETEEKVTKLNDVLDKVQARVDELGKAFNRTAGQGGEQDPAKLEKAERAKYKDAFVNFMRKGVDVSKEMTQWAEKAMSVDSDADGGFLVTPEMSSEIVTKVFESSPIRQLASVQTISTDSLEMLQDLDEAGSGWVGETEARPATSTPQLKKISIPVHELYAFPQATQKLLDDAAVNVEAWLGAKVSEKFARDEATAFVSGNGVAKPKGIFDYASGTSFGQVERQLTTTNSAIAADNLIDVQSKLKEAYQTNAVWLMNRLIIGVIRKLKDATNENYLWQPGLAQGVPPTLLGRPVYMAADMPASVTATTDTLLYGDVRAGYQVVDRVGIRVLRDPYTSKPYVGFYTTKRVGGGVKNFEAIKVLRINT